MDSTASQPAMDTEVKVDDLLRQTEAGGRSRRERAIADSMAKAIAAADADGSGTLSVQELMSVFTSEANARKRERRLWKTVLILGAFLLLVLAANAGLTCAVVLLSKDTSVSSNNLLVVKGTNNPVGTASAMKDVTLGGSLDDVMENYAQLRDSERISFKQGNATHTFRICGSSIDTETKTVLIFTCVGRTLVLADDDAPFRILTTEDVMDNGLTVDRHTFGEMPTDEFEADDSSSADAGQPAEGNDTDAGVSQAGRRLQQPTPGSNSTTTSDPTLPVNSPQPVQWNGGPPCIKCRRWSTNLCGLNICVSCNFGRFCSLIVPIETISVADMISSSALIYRPDILDNPNVPTFL